MTDLRPPSPTYPPLRSQHVDALLDRAGSLLTHSLSLAQTLQRLGDMLVPHFADWANLVLLDEQHDVWRLVLTRNADPQLDTLREEVSQSMREWKKSGSLSERLLAAGEPVVLKDITPEWVEQNISDPVARAIAMQLKPKSGLYLPLEIDGGLLGSLLLLTIDDARIKYGDDDVRTARRLSMFVAAAIRNAKLWGALRGELAERRRMERSLQTNMEAMRTLSAGLGHDLGNLLQPLRLRLDSLGSMELPPMAVTDVAAIGNVMEYLQRLTSGLRLLAGDPRSERGPGDVTLLRAWWRDVETVMKDALPPGVLLECELPARMPPAAIPAAALTHIVFNLVQRAGREVKGKHHATVRIWASRVPRRAMVRVGVEDNGSRASTGDRSRSNVGDGDGVDGSHPGLQLVRTLVERAGGHISSHAGPSEGSGFIFTLPLSERRSRPRRSSSLSRVSRVSVVDESTWTTVTDALRACDFYIDESDGLLHGDAQVWITDLPSAGDPERVLEFVMGGARRHVVIVNAHNVRAPHPRVHSLEAPIDPAQLRRILQSTGIGSRKPSRRPTTIEQE